MSTLLESAPKKEDEEQSTVDEFDSYPIYLKHTLFHNEDENVMQVREMEVGQRLYVFDKIKERGNKHFHKNRDYECIKVYERALSVMKWLELKEEKGLYEHLEEKLKELEEQKGKEDGKTEEEKQEEIENVKQDLEYAKQQKEFNQRYKMFLTRFNNTNTKLVEYHKNEGKQDIEMV